jgi:hypothetical protein
MFYEIAQNIIKMFNILTLIMTKILTIKTSWNRLKYTSLPNKCFFFSQSEDTRWKNSYIMYIYIFLPETLWTNKNEDKYFFHNIHNMLFFFFNYIFT